jgi:putative sterol carrier protein
VSTAYVCGDRADVACEDDLPAGLRFNNVYERTKAQGEAILREWSLQTGIPVTILRPSIALGAWGDGRAARFNTIYLLMKMLDVAGQDLAGQRVRLIGRPDVTKNVIPVDWFAAVGWRIIEHGAPRATYHLTHSRPVTLADLAGMLGELFDCRIDLMPPDQFDPRCGTPIERLCGQMMAPYRPYMLQPEPTFDQRRLLQAIGPVQAPEIDLGYFRRLLDYGRRVKWRRAVDLEPAQTPDRSGVRGYFDDFLVSRMHRNLLPDLKNLSARFSIAMKDVAGAQWTLVVDKGVLTEVAPGESAAVCSFTLDSQTFLRIVAGQLPPQRAFFLGRIRIRGNIETGLKVATVLGKFFVAYPYLAETA